MFSCHSVDSNNDNDGNDGNDGNDASKSILLKYFFTTTSLHILVTTVTE